MTEGATPKPEDKPRPDLPTDLTTYRIRLGLTLHEMSAKTGLSPATLHRLEHGLTKVTPRSRVRLQDGLGLTAEEIGQILQRSAAKNRGKRPPQD